VDISSCSEGGYKVGWMQPGEWTEYTVSVLNSGTYDIEARVSTIYSGKSFHININGNNVTGPMTCPNTGDWQRWGSVKVSGVKLNAGNQIMRVVIDSDLFNINLIKFTAASSTPTTPTGSGGAITPSTVQAEDYRSGGEGVGYHDVTGGNSGGKYRTDGVDIESCSDTGGGYNIGYVAAGEWLAYNITASTSGNYTVTLRVSAAGSGKTLHLEVDNARVGSTISVPNTGGYQNWTNVVVPNIPISAGNRVVKVVLESNDINFNWLSFGGSAVEIGDGNSAPVLGSCGANPAQAIAGALVDFFSSATDPDNDIVSFAWDFGDGTFSSGGTAQHVYTAPGVYTATLTADDRKGAWTTETVAVVVGAGSGGETKPLDVHRFRAGFNFAKPGHDYWLLEATLDVPAEFVAENVPVVVECAGAAIHGELNAKGAAKLEDASIKLLAARNKKEPGRRKMSVSIRNADLAQLVLGAASQEAKGAPISVKISHRLQRDRGREVLWQRRQNRKNLLNCHAGKL
jgi:PKD repeat protein